MEIIKSFLEKYGFGVCTFIGEKIGVCASRVRLYFIYLTFVTMGSPVFIYLFTAFWLNIFKYFREDKNEIIA
jgi:phage shock protein PspC (stress-responsive transcriptional regulator)